MGNTLTIVLIVTIAYAYILIDTIHKYRSQVKQLQKCLDEYAGYLFASRNEVLQLSEDVRFLKERIKSSKVDADKVPNIYEADSMLTSEKAKEQSESSDILNENHPVILEAGRLIDEYSKPRRKKPKPKTNPS